jgi:hypothetical protein
MVITKKIFKQLIMGKLIKSDNFDLEEMKEAQRIAIEIIKFAEENNLFRIDLKD